MKKIHLIFIIILNTFTVSFATYHVDDATDCEPTDNELSSKFRFLGDWNSEGIPQYLQPKPDKVSQALINYIIESLPESVNLADSNNNHFGDDIQLNTELVEGSNVYLTMVHEGAAWTNTLGFYTYDVDNPPSTVCDIDSLVIIFPNVSQLDVVKPGDKVLLGEFPAKTGIGYFLIAKGWLDEQDTISLGAHIIFTHTDLNTFTTEEFRQQTILLSFYEHEQEEQRFLLGFEDIKRPGGDNDFNDAVFYITADSGAIDHPRSIPTAFLSGDTTLCDANEAATVKVELKGKAPWSIVYDNGIKQIEIIDIVDSVLYIETFIKDTISLVSVKDKNEIGIVGGKAIIAVSEPTATLEEDLTCAGDDQDGFIINLEGIPPFSLTYSENDVEKTIENIPGSSYELIAPIGSSIKLISMSDQFCEGTVSGESIVTDLGKPTLEIKGTGAICGEGINAVLELNLGGQGPWIVNYRLGEQEHNLQIESSEYQLTISEIGAITFNTIEDSNCTSTIDTSFVIQKKSLPTALIGNLSNDCSVDITTVEIALTGDGPWIVYYNLDGESMIAQSAEDLLNLVIEKSGLFELTGVEDAFCENAAEGSLEIEILHAPTAVISSDPAFCSDNDANIKINLTGTAPFTVVYTDGGIETSVTTEENQFEFITSELKTYTLVSVEDKNCVGKVEGEVIVDFSLPKATLQIDKAVCEDNAQGGFVIDLEGQAPFSLTYLENNQEKIINNLTGNQHLLIAPIGSNIKLVSFNDQFCAGTVVGEGTVPSIEKPTFNLAGSGIICGDEEKAIFDLTLGGQGPWILNYQIGDQEYNLQIESSPYQLEVFEIGELKFNFIEGSNCTSDLSTSINIVKKSLPTATITGYENICGDEAASADIALTGEGPWQIQYSLNGESNIVETDEDLLKLVIDQSGTFELLAVDDASCQNAAEGKIEFEIHEAPIAEISSIEALCSDDAATVQIELTGAAPFTFIYSDGEIETTVTTEENLYEFTTSELKTYILISVNDVNCNGKVSGEAIISFSQPTATLDGDRALCAGDDLGGFIVDLDGQAPFSLTFKIDGEEKTLENITENHIEVKASIGGVIELISMRDQNCEGTVTGVATVRAVQKPSLVVEAKEALCGEDVNAVFDLKLEGQGPWVVSYELNNETYNVPIDVSEYQLKVSETGTLTFKSVVDANCETNLSAIASYNFEIQTKDLPTAIIEDFENTCGEEAASVDILLTGEAPWIVHYTLNGEQKTSESNENLLNIVLDSGGAFELVSVEDANCENVATGTLDIEIHESPTALIGDDVTLCKDEEATIQITLTGTAPFTFIYTDGENETSVTTDDNLYEFTTSDFKTYTLLSVADVNCEVEVSSSITISDGAEDIQVEIDAKVISCFEDVIDLALLGDTDGLTIKWSTEGKGTLENEDQIETKYTPAENEIGIIIFYAEVNNTCAIKTVSTEVTIIEEIIVNFKVSPEADLVTNQQIIFTPENSDYDEYTWDFGDGNSSSATISSTEYSEGGTYTVELLVTKDGCEGNGTEELTVLSKDELYVPNAFNPSARNQENRVVKVYGNNVDETGFSFIIVNRWGKTMYETSSFHEANSIGWDGVNNNNDEKQELSVFSYILKGQFIGGDSFERTGTVTQVK